MQLEICRYVLEHHYDRGLSITRMTCRSLVGEGAKRLLLGEPAVRALASTPIIDAVGFMHFNFYFSINSTDAEVIVTSSYVPSILLMRRSS